MVTRLVNREESWPTLTFAERKKIVALVTIALWIVVGVGALVTIVGLFLLVIVFLDERRKKRGVRAVDWPALLEKILNWIKGMTPRVYRVPMVLSSAH